MGRQQGAAISYLAIYHMLQLHPALRAVPSDTLQCLGIEARANMVCVMLQVHPVLAGLDDGHPYVRRTAVMGVLKIWHMSEDVVESQGMLQHVQVLLTQDNDAQVLLGGRAQMTQAMHFSCRQQCMLAWPSPKTAVQYSNDSCDLSEHAVFRHAASWQMTCCP